MKNSNPPIFSLFLYIYIHINLKCVVKNLNVIEVLKKVCMYTLRQHVNARGLTPLTITNK